MKIVFGLGNPGTRYASTRHNVGYRVADALAERQGASFDVPRGELGDLAWTAEVRIGDEPVVLSKPRTFMNLSGRAGAALLRRYRADVSSLIVVFDDADLALGRVRVRSEGSHGGHNGIRSLIEVLGLREFPRVKLGIRGEGRLESDLAEYVLKPFLPEERPRVAEMVSAGSDAVECAIVDGLEAAMRKYNGPPARGD